MNQQRNASIDIFRLIFAIGVVMGHTFFLYDINKEAAYWVSRVFPRMSVPFFFCISGYFFIKGLMKEKCNWTAQVKKILQIYLFWTILYYAFSFLMTLKNHESIGKFLLLRLRYFFFDGSFYHFWYFTALIYTILIVSFVYKLFKMKGITILAYVSIVLYLLAFIGTDYVGIGSHIPVLKSVYGLWCYETLRGIFCMGLPFFMTGYFLNKLTPVIAKLSDRTALIVFVILYACYLLEAFYAKSATTFDKASEDLAVAFFMIPALMALFVNLLKHPMANYYNQSVVCRKTSNFMYYIHPLLIQIILTAADILSLSFVGETLTFLIVFLLTMAGGMILSKFDNKVTSFMV